MANEGPDLVGSAKGLPVPNNTNLVAVFWAFKRLQVPIKSIAVYMYLLIVLIIKGFKDRHLNIVRICELL
jgi:hypothetical protein